MKVIAGLGNPGAQYANTPHSIGFEVADAVVRTMGESFRMTPAFKAEMASGMFAGVKTLVLKPQTFMNLSGDSIAPAVKYHNATPLDLVVVQDDIDLPVGKIRIRKGGSAGGHNGIRSVIERLGTPDFIRLKIGVGRDRRDRSEVIGHVLGKFDPESRAVMNLVVPAAVKALEQILREGVQAAMNAWNAWSPPEA